MGVLGTILVKLAVSVLSYYQGRADYRALIEKELENAGLKRLAEASKWMVDSGDDGGELRVRPPTSGGQTGPQTPPRVP